MTHGGAISILLLLLLAAVLVVVLAILLAVMEAGAQAHIELIRERSEL